MAKKPETQQQILERYRGDMSKVEFCERLSVSRPTMDKYLDGAYISLEWLTYLSVDFCDDWRGAMANELIVICHGENYVPIGSREELVQMRQFLKNTEFSDMLNVGNSLSPDHFGLWAAELRDRLDRQLEAVKKQVRAEVTA